MIYSLVSLFRFLVLVAVFCSGVHTAPASKQSADKKIDILLKEVEDLGKGLSKFQEQLSAVKKNLTPFKKNLSFLTDQKEVSTFVIVDYVELLSQHLKVRVQEFFKGAIEIGRSFFDPPVVRQPMMAYLAAAMISFCIAVLSLSIGRSWLRKKISTFVDERTNKRLPHFLFITFFFVGVSIGYLGVSVLVGAIIDRFVMTLPHTWYLNCTTLLPLHLYLFWAGIYWVRLACSPHRPSQAFILMDPQSAHRVAYGLRMALALYLSSVLLLSAVEGFKIKTEIIQTVVDSFVLGISFFIFRALSVAHAHLSPTKESDKVLRVIRLIRIVIAVGCGLWFMGRHFLSHFLFPLTSSAF